MTAVKVGCHGLHAMEASLEGVFKLVKLWIGLSPKDTLSDMTDSE